MGGASHAAQSRIATQMQHIYSTPAFERSATEKAPVTREKCCGWGSPPFLEGFEPMLN